MEYLSFLGSGEIGLILMIVLISLVLPVIALIDIVRSDFEGNNKLIWVLVVLFLWVIGSIIYYFIGRNQKIHH